MGEVEDLPKRGTPGWHPSRMVRARKANADQRKTIAKQPAESSAAAVPPDSSVTDEVVQEAIDGVLDRLQQG